MKKKTNRLDVNAHTPAEEARSIIDDAIGEGKRMRAIHRDGVERLGRTGTSIEQPPADVTRSIDPIHGAEATIRRVARTHATRLIRSVPSAAA